MKRLSLRFLFLGLLLSSCGPQQKPQESCNFVQNSQQQRVSWKNISPITLYVHRSVPAQFYQSVQRAMNAWNAAIGRDLLHLGGVVDGDNTPTKNGVSVIHWLSTWEGAGRSFEQARTTIYWTGTQIREADIRINARDFTFSGSDQPMGGAVDFESLILHELGHTLGLQHITNAPSVMAESLANGTLRRDPQPVELDSLRCEY